MAFFTLVKRIGNDLNASKRMNKLQYSHTKRYHAVTKNVFEEMLIIGKLSYIYFKMKKLSKFYRSIISTRGFKAA